MSATAATPAGAALVLRDIHQPPAPAWWPPAPGWWVLGSVVLLIAGCVTFVHWRRHRRRAAIAALFDRTVEAAQTPAERIGAMSELLRRAARTIDPAADTLAGDAWLQFLDRGLEQPVFTAGAGALLRDGAFRQDIADADAEAVRALARSRFLRWMTKR